VAAPAQAGPTFTVDSNGDQADASPANGICATAGGACTLRAAMEEANNVSGAVIQFDPSITGQILLTGTLPTITSSDVTINGPGAGQLAIDGANTYRVLESQSGSSAVISGLTIRHGRAGAGTLVAGGGINAAGDMTLDRVVVTQNTADGGTDAYGGGIAVGLGTLTLRHSTVSDNTATTSGTSATNVNAYGGGIAVFMGGPELVIDHSTISGNTAAGVVVTSAPGTDASGHGGGVYSGGPVTIDQSTISGNTASASGGTNSAFVTGGGYYEDNGGTLTSTGSTFSDNTVSFTGGPGPFFSSDGANIALVPTPGATVRSSIVANPTGGNNCVSNGVPLVSNGFNLDEDGSCEFDQATDIEGQDPMLGPLASNGGPTQTQRLLAGSPAADKGNSFGALTDQRGAGFARVSDSAAIANASGGDGTDIGAFERDVVAPNKPVITASVPRSPSNLNSLKLRGTAEAGSIVRIYKTAGCTGSPVKAGLASAFASPGLGLTVASNTTTVFRVTATDSSGNTSACSNGFSYVEDSIPPNTSIGSVTVSHVKHRATITFSSTEAGSTFRCRIDAQVYAPCRSPKGFAGLATGRHTFRVRAIDRAGNADPTPATTSFTV
jgi:hypothetical protein